MRRSQGEWARIVARYRKSGQTTRRFSAEEGFRSSAIRYNQIANFVLAQSEINIAIGDKPSEALSFVSLFDDTLDVWNDEDYQLVSGLSTVVRWSRPDEFASLLSDVA